ncbi:hypothetical protein CUU66_08365 [Peribacillus deserti]|uniref:Uncharacterized protein n=1 Tax=Peribacillus deserti TaxID=673318 RepID=A0A2N5M7J9_9BACI|nr:hypothetical protein CUU66_08365 [Peribacillus deserti]
MHYFLVCQAVFCSQGDQFYVWRPRSLSASSPAGSSLGNAFQALLLEPTAAFRKLFAISLHSLIEKTMHSKKDRVQF